MPEIRNWLSSAEPGAPTGSSTAPKRIAVPGSTGLPWRSVPSALTMRLSVASGSGGMFVSSLLTSPDTELIVMPGRFGATTGEVISML
jgi:hypothetical protein